MQRNLHCMIYLKDVPNPREDSKTSEAAPTKDIIETADSDLDEDVSSTTGGKKRKNQSISQKSKGQNPCVQPSQPSLRTQDKKAVELVNQRLGTNIPICQLQTLEIS